MKLSQFPRWSAAFGSTLLTLPVVAAAVEGVPFAKRQPASGRVMFDQVHAKESGLAHAPKVHSEHALSFLYHSGFVCGAVAVGDLNADGKRDLVFGGAAEKNRVYLGAGEFKFTEVTEKLGAVTAGERWTTGVSLVDVNGDGRLDIYTCNYEAPNQLFLNTGNDAGGVPQFKDVAAAAGVAAVDSSHSAYFADYDRDGDLDLFLLTNKVEDPGGQLGGERTVVEFVDGAWRLKPGMDRYYDFYNNGPTDRGTQTIGRPDLLFRNEGNGADGTPKFADVTAKAGIKGRGDGLSATWWDFNTDGWPDLFVANDFLSEDKLWKNNGDGTFTNVLPQAAPHTCWFSMGADQGDLNNDLLPDFLVADMAATSHYKSKTTMGAMGGADLISAVNSQPPQYMRNTCLIGTGTERFVEAAYLLGIASTDWTWSVKFADFDLDGWEDIYFTNGMIRAMNHSDFVVGKDKMVGKHQWEFYKDRPERPEKHRAYKNEQHLHFGEVSEAWGLGREAITYGCAYADFDRDGDLDLVEVNLGEPPSLYKNGSTEGHAVEFRLTAKDGNPSCYGARVEITTAAGRQMRVLFPQSGYHSLNDAVVHFGLGKDAVIAKAVVTWPRGQVETFEGLKADQLYTLTAPAGEPAQAPGRSAAAPSMFVKADKFPPIRHQEQPYDDYADQILLPHAMSQLGPALAWGDVNGDGHADFFMGGGAEQPGELRLADGKGGYKAQWVDDFRTDKASEDMGAVFFDADGDADLDLFVASGSSQFKRGDERLRDRLYLNDGKGGFKKAADAIPDFREASGPVCVADFDRDGRMDVYVGSRSVPAEYPSTPPSRLLRNVSEKGKVKFTDATEAVPGLRNSGMVSGAVWSDVNGDGWQDLLLAHEWGKIALFVNTKGKLAQREGAEDDLAQNSGWWLSVDTADLDGDGDMDVVAGNFGFNTKYKEATKQKPKLLYYGDMDGTGKKNIVEVKREGDILYPERGRSCSSTAMPGLKVKFPTYETFAKATLSEVYGDSLEKAEKFEANTLGTGIFWNDGGKFRYEALDRLAQAAPAFGVVVADFDGDGLSDLFLAQNFHSPQIETGRYDGGVGQILLNKGKGHFDPVNAARSGIAIPGDAKAATVCDLNGDSAPDLLVSINAGAPAAYYNSTPAAKRLTVKLDSARAPGAKVMLERAGAPALVAEYHAGGSYLSQGPAAVSFPAGAAGKMRVAWPDGTETEAAFGAADMEVKFAPVK